MNKLFKNKKDYKQLLKWIEALRSGKYSQTTDTLQDGDGFCCLGVACKVLIPKKKQFTDSHGELQGIYPKKQFHSPNWLKNINDDLYNLQSEINNNNNNRRLSLVNLNDDKRFTFDEIADILELTYVHEAWY